MFASFFPNPRQFFPSVILWTILSMVLWYLFMRDLGEVLSLGRFIGFPFPGPLPTGADEATQAARDIVRNTALDIWVYQYMIVSGAIFSFIWSRVHPHPWFRWSVVAAAVILFIIWFKVQLDVMINNWFGTFYDMIQSALAKPNSISLDGYFGQLITFTSIAMVYIVVAVFNAFLVQHFVFRWRTAMNNYYVANWTKLRKIEGASQRIQEDTMRFAQTVEDLGESLIDSIMTLIAFLPILWGFSVFVKELPVFGAVPQALVIVAVTWSVLGTGLLAIAGIRLPGLQFRNQRVEAAFRKELVLGEDNAERAQPPTLAELFNAIRINRFRFYLNYLYFNVVRYSYLQAGVMVPYVALAPTIVVAGFTLGVMQQILRAFDRVSSSFQYLVNSWSTIIELMSIYKRLKAFEATLHDQPLGEIEREASPA